MRLRYGQWFGFIAMAVASWPALAQDTPALMPMRLILGFPPGATTDLVARLLAQKLTQEGAGNVIAENRPGANANIAAEFVARAKADGQTLLFNTPSIVLSYAFGEKLSYDVLKDFSPVALVASSPYVLVVHPSLPVKTVSEFITLARAHPGKLSYGAAGSLSHLAPLTFLQAHKLSALHVPYKGGGPVVVDLIGGRLQFAMTGQTAVLPMVKNKRLRAIALTALRRSALMTDVPTLHESGMPGFETGAWFGVLTPTGTPPTVIQRLNASINKVMQDPDMIARLAQEGAEPMSATPEQYSVYFSNEIERWSKLIKATGLRADLGGKTFLVLPTRPHAACMAARGHKRRAHPTRG